MGKIIIKTEDVLILSLRASSSSFSFLVIPLLSNKSKEMEFLAAMGRQSILYLYVCVGIYR